MAKVLKIVGAVVGIAALAIVTGGAAAGFGISLATTAFGISAGALLAVSAGLQVLGGLLAPRPKPPATSPANEDRLFASIDPRTPRKIVFGRTAMATDIRDQEYTDNQGYFHRFLVVAGHAATSVDEIWFDDKLAWTAAGGAQGDYKGYLDVAVRLEGSAGNAINISPRMGSSRRFTGLAYVHFRYRLTGLSKGKDSPFAQSIPSRVTIIGQGMPLYDPRLDSSVGGSGEHRAGDQNSWRTGDLSRLRNPALQLLAYLLGWRIQNPVTGEWRLSVGKGLPIERIDIASFITAANMCDEPVVAPGVGTEPRYRSDGIFQESDDPKLVRDQLLASMNAVLDDIDGQLRLTVLHNDLGTPLGRLTTDDVIGEFTWDQTPPLQDTFNVVRGTYVEPSAPSLYQTKDYPEVRGISPDGIDRVEPINYQTVQSPTQAQRLSKMRLARMLYSGTFTAVFQATAWKFQKNDLILFDFAPLGWANVPMRIVDIAVQLDGLVPLMLRVENAAIYAAYDDATAPVPAVEPTRYDLALDPIRLRLATLGNANERGDWDAAVDYVEGNIVSLPDGSRWAAIGAPTKGVPPSSTNPGWQRLTRLQNVPPTSIIGGVYDPGSGTIAGGRPAYNIAGDLNINTTAIVEQALRLDDLATIMDARTYVEGQPVSTVFQQFRNAQQTQNSAVNSALQLLGAKTSDGSGWSLNLDTVQVGNGRTLGQQLSEIGATNGQLTTKVQRLQEALIDPDGQGRAKFVLSASVVNGRTVLSGITGTADGVNGNLAFASGSFTFVDNSGNNPITVLEYVNNRWEFSADVYAKKLVAGAIDIEFTGAKQNLDPNGWFQIIPGGLIVQGGRYRAQITSESSFSVVFPIPYPNQVLACVAIGYIATPSNLRDLWLQNLGAPSRQGASFYAQAARGDAQNLDGFDWIAVGK